MQAVTSTPSLTSKLVIFDPQEDEEEEKSNELEEQDGTQNEAFYVLPNK